MGRSRSRSRSRRRDGGNVAEAAKSGSSEQEIVSVAIRQLPTDIRERLEKLFEEGLLKEGDLDLRSITVFASLNEGLQARVMNHMEGERIYVANARSKSGFLIATCDKAKTGCLDARGLGAIDPWRTALVAMATPKMKLIDLKPERDWLDEHDEDAVINIQVNLGSDVEGELGVPSVTVQLPLTETSAAITAKLVAMGVKSIPANKMMLHSETIGFLKGRYTFAYYNFKDGVTLALSQRKRAGARFRADHTVMPKRPRTQTAPAAPAAPAAAPSAADALKNLTAATAATLPGLPNLPKLPSMPTAGAGGMPGMPNFPTGLPNLAGLPGFPGMTGLPGAGGTNPAATPPKLGAPGLLGGLGTGPAPGLGGTMPGFNGTGPLASMMGDLAKAKASLPGGLPGFSMPSLGDLAKAGGLPGLPPPGADPKAAAMAFMAKMGGGAPPGLGMSGPGIGGPGAPPAVGMSGPGVGGPGAPMGFAMGGPGGAPLSKAGGPGFAMPKMPMDMASAGPPGMGGGGCGMVPCGATPKGGAPM